MHQTLNYAGTRLAVDLWDLVVWAYRRQKVVEATGKYLFDGEASAGGDEVYRVSLCGCAAIERKRAIGVTIDGGSAPRGTAPDVHPDAEALHDRVLAMSSMRLG